MDDDVELSEELAELLEAEGYEADTVTDGPGGLNLIWEKAYDVFLVDFKMQGMTGLDVVKEIREKDRKAAVFLVSGRPGLAALLEKEKLAGAVSGIIEKPFDAAVLLEKIGEACAAR